MRRRASALFGRAPSRARMGNSSLSWYEPVTVQDPRRPTRCNIVSRILKDSRMRIDVSEERSSNLEDYARIRMSFAVEAVLDVTPLDDGFGRFRLSERKLDTPYLKDYDAIENPLQWPRSFDVSNWGFFAARSNGLRVGGATVAFNTSGLTMLEARRDIGVLWDIRVAPEARWCGVGGRCSGPSRNGPWREVADGSRLKLKTSTCLRAGSMQSMAAYWERFTPSPIQRFQMKRNCSGIKN